MHSQGKRRRTRDRNGYKINNTTRNRLVAQNMTPNYQLQTSQPRSYADNFEVRQHDAYSIRGGYGGGNNVGGYQEYDNVSFYRNGSYGKTKKKSKKRDMTQVYGYNGSHKCAGAGNFRHFRTAERYQNDGSSGDPADELMHAYDMGIPRGATQRVEHANAGQHQQRYGQTPSYAAGFHEAAQLADYRAVQAPTAGVRHLSSHKNAVKSYDYTQNQRSGGASIEQQISLAEKMRLYSDYMTSEMPSDLDSTNGRSYVHDSFAAHAFAAEDQANTMTILHSEQHEGATLADHELVLRFHTGAFASFVETVAALYKETERAFFPSDRPTSKWPEKTVQEMAYVHRVQQLSVLGEEELTGVYEMVASGANRVDH